MKKLFILLLTSTICCAQTYVSANIDFRNSTFGSKPTNFKPAVDAIYKFGMIGSIPGHKTKIEITIGYEVFNRIKFDRYFSTIGVQIPITEKLIAIPSYEFSIIGRWGQEWQTVSSHLAVLGSNVVLRYKLNDKFSFDFTTAILDRVDLNTRYGGSNVRISNYVGINYKL
jgi:hypothetical protein